MIHSNDLVGNQRLAPDRNPSPAAPLWGVVALAAASPALTWWAVGPLGAQWPDRELGPFHVSVLLERIALGVALALAVAGAAAISVPALRRRARRTVSPWTASGLVAPGVVGAIGWRVETAGGVGANIGAGLVELTVPLVVAGLLVGAVAIEANRPGRGLRHTKALAVAALLVAPALVAADRAVVSYDQSIGVISAGEYASVHRGESHSAVRDRLGRPGDVVDWFFTSPAAGSRCDYYTDNKTGPLMYQICYRADTVVSAKASEHPAA
jgi:hypothetical protein